MARSGAASGLSEEEVFGLLLAGGTPEDTVRDLELRILMARLLRSKRRCEASAIACMSLFCFTVAGYALRLSRTKPSVVCHLMFVLFIVSQTFVFVHLIRRRRGLTLEIFGEIARSVMEA